MRDMQQPLLTVAGAETLTHYSAAHTYAEYAHSLQAHVVESKRALATVAKMYCNLA